MRLDKPVASFETHPAALLRMTLFFCGLANLGHPEEPA
jgi:hypothetical protein